MYELDASLNRIRADLESDVQRLEYDLRSDLDRTRTDLDTFTSGWSSAQELYEIIDERTRDLDTKTTSALRQIQHTATWLARYARPGGPPPVIDPTLQPATRLLALALEADQAAFLSEQLLPDTTRVGFQHDITRHEKWKQSHSTHAAAALAASETLAATDPAQPEHAQAAAQFAQAQRNLAHLDRARDDIEARAQTARSALHDDDLARAEHGHELTEGTQAADELRSALKQQISTALGAGDLFAPWFTSCLGFTPYGSGWLDLAADVCAYRITYHITGEKPLGEAPQSDCSARRREWHDELLSTLAIHPPI
jgi:hypothetical protein